MKKYQSLTQKRYKWGGFVVFPTLTGGVLSGLRVLPRETDERERKRTKGEGGRTNKRDSGKEGCRRRRKREKQV